MLPASLRVIRIYNCSKLKSIYSWRLQQGQSAPRFPQGPSHLYSEVSLSSAIARVEHLLFPCLKHISIWKCDSLTGVLVLPPSLKRLLLFECDELRSVESHSGEIPSLLEDLDIEDCKTLSALPDGPQAYSSLRKLEIINCPGVKRLPTSLQQRLSSIEEKHLDARYEEPRLVKPKTWINVIRN